MRALMLKGGANEWNHITDTSIGLQFQLIQDNNALAVIAEENEIAGFAILILKEACPSKLTKYTGLASIAYINDVVVSANHSGKGIGSTLLDKAVDYAGKAKCAKVYIERHEENLESAGMMRKSQFEIVDTFHDPEKRSSGSRKTSILVRPTQTD